MDEAAFTRVYREHVDFVWRLSRSLGVDAGHLDDVVHEVFLVVRRRFDDRERRAPLRRWLAGITRNVVMHFHRGRGREARRVEQAFVPTRPRDPDEELDLAQAAALMQTFLDTLEPAQREVFALMEIEGLSAPEVAHVCSAKVATVYTRLRAARGRFARFVEDVQRVGKGGRADG
jgi:RNA polymerase sigma-70 factor (ECF subfamily)